MEYEKIAKRMLGVHEEEDLQWNYAEVERALWDVHQLLCNIGMELTDEETIAMIIARAEEGKG